MNNDSPFKEIYLSSFDEFELAYSDIRMNRKHYKTVFRGQAEAIWGLVPSVLRGFSDDVIPMESIRERIMREYIDVSYFVIIADRMGFDLPGDLFELLNPIKFNISEDKSFYDWYCTTKAGWKEVISIAQHYGVKTRYLDFTFNPYTALFFAAMEVTRKYLGECDKIPESNNHFSLWMLDKDYLNNSCCTIDHFEVPTARNKYLNAQKGLFLSPPLPPLYDAPFYGDTKKMNVNKKSLDIMEEVMGNNYHSVNNGDLDLKRRWPIIYKYNFSFTIAPTILQELDAQYDINIATQKPNLENIINYRQFREKVNDLACILRDDSDRSP
ncbi:MAG: FRG domain-containing protein [Thermodesulfobacteriota bacterium]